MNKVLISGITGFVGINLKAYLGTKYQILGVSRKSTASNLLTYDSLSKTDMDEAIAFIHLAGKAHDLKNVSSDEDYYQANSELTKKLYNTFIESDCKIFIFMSSVKAAADKVEDILTEKVNPNPQTAYGKSKLQAEEYILTKKIPKGKYVYILRPCMIHGPNNKGNLNLLYNIINKGIPYPLGSFKNKRSFLSVDNLSFVIKKLIELQPKSGIYNIADDISMSTNELVTTIGKVIGNKTTIIKIPKPIIRLIAKFGDILPFPLNTDRLYKLTDSYQVSNSKIKTALCQEFPLSTVQGIEKTINSFSKKQ